MGGAPHSGRFLIVFGCFCDCFLIVLAHFGLFFLLFLGLGVYCFETFGQELILIVFCFLWGLFDCAFGPLALADREPPGAKPTFRNQAWPPSKS